MPRLAKSFLGATADDGGATFGRAAEARDEGVAPWDIRLPTADIFPPPVPGFSFATPRVIRFATFTHHARQSSEIGATGANFHTAAVESAAKIRKTNQ